MRRICRILIVAAVLATAITPLLAVQAAPSLARTSKASTLRVGLGILDGINDDGFNALADQGLKQAEAQLHVKANVIVTQQTGNYVPTLQAFVNDHDNLIIAVGALWGNDVYQVASANKNVRFAIVDGYPLDSKNHIHHLKNVATLQFKSQQSGYIAGVIAGLLEKHKVGAAKHNVIAALGAIPLPFINAQMCGYWQGAKSVDKNVKFVDAYVGGFFSIPQAQAIGQQQIQDDHADILFGVADASGLGYYKAAKEAHKYAIGFAADQDGLGSFMLTSAEVGINVAVFRIIKEDANGTFWPNEHVFSIKNGGIGYAKNMHHVPAKIRQTAATVAADLASGKIVANPACKLPSS